MKTNKLQLVILMLFVISATVMIVTTTTQMAQAVISKCPGTQTHPYEQCLADDARETLKAIARGLLGQ
jgi:hypothetical protein